MGFRRQYPVRGEKVTHTFSAKGEYQVNLEVALRSESDGQIKKTGISKKIIIFNDAHEGTTYLGNGVSVKMKHSRCKKQR